MSSTKRRSNAERVVTWSLAVVAAGFVALYFVGLGAILVRGAGKALSFTTWATPLLIYFVSFFIVGGVWIRHRRVLASLRRVDLPVTLLTLALLSLVSLMPVVVRVMLTADGVSNDGMLFYALALLANYLCLAASWGYAAFVGDLAPDVPARRAWTS